MCRGVGCTPNNVQNSLFCGCCDIFRYLAFFILEFQCSSQQGTSALSSKFYPGLCPHVPIKKMKCSIYSVYRASQNLQLPIYLYSVHIYIGPDWSISLWFGLMMPILPPLKHSTKLFACHTTIMFLPA